MASFDLVTFAVLALAVGGLAAVLWEVLVKDPSSLVEMTADSRRFAEAPVVGEAAPSPRQRPANTGQVAANVNDPRLAA